MYDYPHFFHNEQDIVTRSHSDKSMLTRYNMQIWKELTSLKKSNVAMSMASSSACLPTKVVWSSLGGVPRVAPNWLYNVPMIPVISKFPTRIDFLSFRKHANQSHTPHLRVMTLPHAPSRLSVIVPRKLNKLAVARNSFKRLVYDQVWGMIKDKNLDCIVTLKSVFLAKGKISEEIIKNELSQNSSIF